MVRHHCRVR